MLYCLSYTPSTVFVLSRCSPDLCGEGLGLESATGVLPSYEYVYVGSSPYQRSPFRHGQVWLRPSAPCGEAAGVWRQGCVSL